MSATEPTPLRGAIIGCGDISGQHLRTYRQLGVRLMGVCDLDAKRADAALEEFGTEDTRAFTSVQTLLQEAELDFVTVATPVAYHAPLTLQALQAGLHVACEKPSTLALAENDAIIEASRANAKHVIFFSARFREGPAAIARTHIEDGDLGEIYQVRLQFRRGRGRPGVDMILDAPWFAQRKLAGGGIMMDMGQYFMDMTLDLVGWPRVTSVSASTFRGFPHNLPPDQVYDVEEQATILARTDSGVTLNYELANIGHCTDGLLLEILGLKGGILIEGNKSFKFITEKGGPWKRMIHEATRVRDWEGSASAYGQFFRAIRGESHRAGTNPEQARAITELSLMAYESAEACREVTPETLQNTNLGA